MQIYNTLTRGREEFAPLKDNEVNIYVCGPTVYDFFHIGNARVFITFDTFRRFLKYLGYKVTYVQNFTDIDDKLIKRANEEGITVKELAEKYIQEYFKDADALGIDRADYHPRATETIFDIIDLVNKLYDKGYAYEVDGDVYYRTRKFEGYGKLSHQDIDELTAGARIEVGEKKEDPLDFALWKKAKQGEPAWESPWGNGRPGWHIECSAMALKYLDETIDIHAGGPDLIFPHHENEIAQSEGATGKPFAKYWMHVGYLNINNEKMSKSLGNFFTARDVLSKYDPEVIRFFMLSAHYRSPINYSMELIDQSQKGLERLYNTVDDLTYYLKNTSGSTVSQGLTIELEPYKERYIKAIEDDFNTADAISVLFELSREINTALRKGLSVDSGNKALALMKELGGILGILKKEREIILEEEIELLIKKREEARKEKDWLTADSIRAQLKKKGIILEDTPGGVRWKKEIL